MFDDTFNMTEAERKARKATVKKRIFGGITILLLLITINKQGSPFL